MEPVTPPAHTPRQRDIPKNGRTGILQLPGCCSLGRNRPPGRGRQAEGGTQTAHAELNQPQFKAGMLPDPPLLAPVPWVSARRRPASCRSRAPAPGSRGRWARRGRRDPGRAAPPPDTPAAGPRTPGPGRGRRGRAAPRPAPPPAPSPPPPPSPTSPRRRPAPARHGTARPRPV